MIQLHRDYLLVETPGGQVIPCSAESIAVELVGEALDSLDPELVRQAASAVLHYFKEDLGMETVSVGEFSRALADSLKALGIRIESEETADSRPILSYDLRRLVFGNDRAFELSFFPNLRREFQSRIGNSPKMLRFHGLRGCVKELVGAKHWSPRCEMVSDQIVEFLRACLEAEPSKTCRLVIC